MRRGGQNPTESEVQDMINSVSNGQAQKTLNGATYVIHNCIVYGDGIAKYEYIRMCIWSGF